jgi:hypothetical protein
MEGVPHLRGVAHLTQKVCHFFEMWHTLTDDAMMCECHNIRTLDKIPKGMLVNLRLLSI